MLLHRLFHNLVIASVSPFLVLTRASMTPNKYQPATSDIRTSPSPTVFLRLYPVQNKFHNIGNCLKSCNVENQNILRIPSIICLEVIQIRKFLLNWILNIYHILTPSIWPIVVALCWQTLKWFAIKNSNQLQLEFLP